MLENSDCGSDVNKQDFPAPDTRTDNLSNVDKSDVNVVKDVQSQIQCKVVGVQNDTTSGVHDSVTFVLSGVTESVYTGATGI